MKGNKKTKQKVDRKVLLALAAHWVKDKRTIQKWFDTNSPMLEHADSKKIIKAA